MKTKITVEEWIKQAEERIDSNETFIDEVYDMCGTDWSRHRSQMEGCKRENQFLLDGIELLKGKENE